MNPSKPQRKGASHAGTAVVAVAVAAALVGMGACRGRPRPEPVDPASAPASEAASSSPWLAEDLDLGRPHVAEINIGGGLPEVYRAGLFGAPKKRAFSDLIKLLGELVRGEEDNVRGLVLRLGGEVGYARAEEVAGLLGEIREQGTPVVCHADDLGNTAYWMAAQGCDRIWVSPAGNVDTVGVAAQLLFGKRLLASLKVDVDFLQVGKYKGAEEPFTRDEPSEEARQSLLSTLGGIRSRWLDGIQAGRGEQAREAAEQGPFAPSEAIGKGLVDQVGYAGDARADALRMASVEQVVPRFGPRAKNVEPAGLVEVVRLVSGAGVGADVPHVAVLRAIGGITSRSSGSPFSEDGGIAESELSPVLRKLDRDASTKAVVLRLDSPGGSALASDLLWNQLMELRRSKPLIVSIGDMAASGGYYMACAGTRIFAESTSIVGSIGVVAGKFAVPRGLDHLGVSVETLAPRDTPGAAARAAYLSPLVPWDDETRRRVRQTVESVYDLFVERVTAGRGIPRDRVAAFAEGRLFAASDGIKLGMVDELGGLTAAIAYARRAAGLEPDAPVRVVGEESGLERLLDLEEDSEIEGDAESAARLLMLRALLRSTGPGLHGFLQAYEPLLQGERTLVTVPFALLIR